MVTYRSELKINRIVKIYKTCNTFPVIIVCLHLTTMIATKQGHFIHIMVTSDYAILYFVIV